MSQHQNNREISKDEANYLAIDYNYESIEEFLLRICLSIKPLEAINEDLIKTRQNLNISSYSTEKLQHLSDVSSKLVKEFNDMIAEFSSVSAEIGREREIYDSELIYRGISKD